MNRHQAWIDYNSANVIVFSIMVFVLAVVNVAAKVAEVDAIVHVSGGVGGG